MCHLAVSRRGTDGIQSTFTASFPYRYVLLQFGSWHSINITYCLIYDLDLYIIIYIYNIITCIIYIYIYTPFLKWPGTCRSHALHLRSHKRSQRNCEVDQSTMNLYSPISTLINPIHPPFTLNESKVWPCPARGSRDA